MDNIDQQLICSVQDGIREGVKSKLGGYNSPLDKIINNVLDKHNGELSSLLNDAITSAIGNFEFREEIRNGLRHKLATLLVQRFGGELEKQVNVLKSDPTTRARITLAIEEIVKEKNGAVTTLGPRM